MSLPVWTQDDLDLLEQHKEYKPRVTANKTGFTVKDCMRYLKVKGKHRLLGCNRNPTKAEILDRAKQFVANNEPSINKAAKEIGSSRFRFESALDSLGYAGQYFAKSNSGGGSRAKETVRDSERGFECKAKAQIDISHIKQSFLAKAWV